MDWLAKYIQPVDSYPRPDWEKIAGYVEEKLASKDQCDLYTDIAKYWVGEVQTKLGSTYKVHESQNFLLLTAQTDDYVDNFITFMEKTRKKVLSALSGIAVDDGYGMHVIFVFENQDDYYDYIAHFYPEEGEFGLSAGCYLNNGYGHFAFPYLNISDAESTAAHELTHSLVSHLPLPLWLDEGIAVGMEGYITGFSYPAMDKQMHNRHLRFWSEDLIQEFWSGESFSRTDDGQELSYHLANFMVNSLSQSYDGFVEFTTNAAWQDAGEVALNDLFDASLEELLTPILGDGDWQPNPQKWGSK